MNIAAKHLEAKVFHLKGWIELIDPALLVDFFQCELEQAEFTILNFVSNEFPYNGFTAVWVLAESHLALHTFTESGWTYMELTSCNQYKAERFKESIVASDYRLQLDEEKLGESWVFGNDI